MGIQEDIKELKELLVQQDAAKKKKFRYPFGKKVGKGQKRKNYVTMININENKIIDFNKYEIIDQTIIHKFIPRLATADCVLLDRKGNPVIIQPNWSVEPFSPTKHFEESLEEGSNANAYALLMSRMETEKTDAKKKIGGSMKWIIGLALAGLVLYAILSGGGA